MNNFLTKSYFTIAIAIIKIVGRFAAKLRQFWIKKSHVQSFFLTHSRNLAVSPSSTSFLLAILFQELLLHWQLIAKISRTTSDKRNYMMLTLRNLTDVPRTTFAFQSNLSNDEELLWLFVLSPLRFHARTSDNATMNLMCHVSSSVGA